MSDLSRVQEQYPDAWARLARGVHDRAKALGLNCIGVSPRLAFGVVSITAYFDLTDAHGEWWSSDFHAPMEVSIEAQRWEAERALQAEWRSLMFRMR